MIYTVVFMLLFFHFNQLVRSFQNTNFIEKVQGKVAQSKMTPKKHNIVFTDTVDSSKHVQMEVMNMRNSMRRIETRVNPSRLHELTFAVKNINSDKLENLLMERSTPGSSLYQSWLSHEEVSALTVNTEASTALMSWFEENNLKVIWTNKRLEYFCVQSTVLNWEKLLHTKFYEFHEAFGRIKDVSHTVAIRAESYSLPEHIAIHTHTVFGVTDFPAPIRRTGSIALEVAGVTTPLTLANQYSIPISGGMCGNTYFWLY